MKWCHGEANLADGLTQETAQTQLGNFYNGGCTWSLVCDKAMVNARKRRKKGQPPLAEPSMEDRTDLEKEWIHSWPPNITTDSGTYVLDPEADERALLGELNATASPELRETWERLYWQP